MIKRKRKSFRKLKEEWVVTVKDVNKIKRQVITTLVRDVAEAAALAKMSKAKFVKIASAAYAAHETLVKSQARL